MFPQPGEENNRIWRYMDFTKFVSLLERQSLFFCRVDRLGDPFEGSLPKTLAEKIYSQVQKQFPEAQNNYITEVTKTTMNVILKQYNFVNCWHINSQESAAMWRLYLKSDEGIAIQSTFGRLKNSLGDLPKNTGIYRVRYIDYDTDTGDVPPAAVYKRKSFEHENELRVSTYNFGNEISPGWERTDGGVYIPVDLDVLIEKVYVSPTSEQWFCELVESIVKKYDLKNGQDIVVRSNLYSDPLY